MIMVQKIEVTGVIDENAYIYVDENSGHGFLIDPGAEASKIADIIIKNNWVIEGILITHAHFDHIGAVMDLKRVLKCPVYGYKNGDKYLLNPYYNLSAYFGESFILQGVGKVLDGDILSLKANPRFYLKVMHTPGHTEDSCIYYNHEVAFVGDTIFKGSVGNTSLPGGNEQVLWNSIMKKIFLLPLDTKLYSGHSDVTTVSLEKKRYQIDD